ncbi:MAG: hypothetical protein AAFY11_05990 [Cyanobacteria bacterium J06641_5]
MAIIALRAWHLQGYEPIAEVLKRPHDLRLSKGSLLKTALRADFLDDRDTVQQSAWFERYLEGQSVEFYLEGSGTYAIANIDLVSHEVYFDKRDTSAWLDPTIYCSTQTEYTPANEALAKSLAKSLERLNRRSRYPLRADTVPRTSDDPLRLSDSQLRQIRKSLLFVADCTPIATVEGLLVPSPQVCVELGYALGCKPKGQILLARMSRSDCTGRMPFDLANYQQVSFKSATELQKTLPQILETSLQRFNLLQ